MLCERFGKGVNMVDLPTTIEGWNERGSEYFPGHLGLNFTKVEAEEVVAMWGHSLYRR